MVDKPSKTAVVLFNLGGPDTLNAVKPFLFNLFYDKAIIRLPNPLRYFIAKLISAKREHEALEIYRQIGNKSPLLENTQAQADALQTILGDKHRIFIVMRYWHPRLEQTLKDIQAWCPDEIVLLPLYPQFSTTTTESSLHEWHELTSQLSYNVPTRTVGCYPFHPLFLKSYQELINRTIEPFQDLPYRLLFSAHGLPKKIVDAGDPYAWQVQRCVETLVRDLELPGLDWRVCYQSRVGLLEWLKPYTDVEIRQAAQENLGVVVVPIAFISEHSETLVELDIQYRKLALEHGAPFYACVPTVGCHPQFIAGLAEMVKNPYTSLPMCPIEYKNCFCRKINHV
jgi:ferrochelatase